MTDWKTYIGQGPWQFAPQRDKWAYLNNKRWTLGQDAIDFSNNLGMPIDKASEHTPCGHWHKVPIVAPEPIPQDDLYVLHTGLISGATPGSDSAWKRTKDLVEIIHYGTRGSGIDQLRCPSCIAVDDTYVWITDFQNNRVMQRNKSDLTYVQHLAMSSARCVHASPDSVIWVSQGTRLYELSKTDLSTIRLIQAPFADQEGYLRAVEDITYDGTYIYMVDYVYHRVLYYDASSLTYQGEFGTYKEWALTTAGVAFGGGYLYIADGGGRKVYKVDPLNYNKTASIGHITGGSAYNRFDTITSLFYNSSKLYISDSANSNIKVLDPDLVYITDITYVDMDYPQAVCADANYIYVADLYGYVHKFNAVTYAHILSVDLGSSFNMGIACDANYVYVTNQDLQQILRLNATTLAIIDWYDWSGGLTLDIVSSEVRNHGSVISGAYTDTEFDDSTRYVLAPTNPGGIDLELTVNVGVGRTLDELRVNGYFNGFGQVCDICVYNNTTLVWDTLSTMTSRISDTNYTPTLDNSVHQDGAGNVRILFITSSTDTAHRLYIDKVNVSSFNALAPAFSDPKHICIDGSYLYISDEGDGLVHRISKATMTYVDSLNPASTYVVGQAVFNGSSIYVVDYRDANYYGGVQEYNVGTMVLISESPDTYGDDRYWMNQPEGITCDRDYIYVANGTGAAPYHIPGEVKIYDRSSHTYIDKFSVGDFEIGGISVDDDYIYVPIIHWLPPPLAGYTKKFLKTAPYTEILSCDDILAISNDTFYPWYDYDEPVPDTSNEPQIWRTP